LDVVLSLLAWWNPNAMRRRRRLGSRATQGGLRDMTRDVRWGVRGLVRRPAFAAIAITTFGIGIAAPATIYSVVDAVLVKGLPYADAEELVVLGQTIPGREWVEDSELNALIGMSGPAFRDWREQSRTVTAMEAVERRTLLVPKVPTRSLQLEVERGRRGVLARSVATQHHHLLAGIAAVDERLGDPR
jgi:hypothetical protein